MTEYREIQTTAPKADGSRVVDIELDDPSTFTTEEPVQETAAVVPELVVALEPQKEQRVSRAQKRIKELHSDVQQERLEKEELKRQMVELQKQLLQGHASTKESFKTTLEGQIKSLAGQMTAAMTSGDSGMVVQLQDQLMNAKIELQSLNKELSSHAQEITKAESAQTSQQSTAPNRIPERALEWIEDHQEFKTDELFHNAAITVNNQLLREGYDPESDAFYQEIDKRLGKRFPEVFGIAEQTSVQLSQSKSSDVKQPDVKDQVVDVAPATSTKVRTVEQTVSGSSRPSANSIPQRKTTQVTLSPQDVKQAEAWGLSLEQMARRIAHAEANKGANGYVPISMKH